MRLRKVVAITWLGIAAALLAGGAISLAYVEAGPWGLMVVLLVLGFAIATTWAITTWIEEP